MRIAIINAAQEPVELLEGDPEDLIVQIAGRDFVELPEPPPAAEQPGIEPPPAEPDEIQIVIYDEAGIPLNLLAGSLPELAPFVKKAAHFRVLNGTTFENHGTPVGLPTLAEFDELNPQQ